ncbi:MAG: hypothetical protein ABWZ08_12275 [Pseudoxanthomonas sp.]
MDMELARMGIVYVHLIACCVALGVVFMSDIGMMKRLLDPDSTEKLHPQHFHDLHKTVSRALWALWITGAGLVALDMTLKGASVLANPKLQAKIAIVCLLTINGVALARYVMPRLQRVGCLMGLSFSDRMLAAFIGCVSGVSWFYAAMLGVGRPLNFKYSILQIMAAYPVLIGGGFVMMVFLTAWAQYKTSGLARAYEPTRVGTYSFDGRLQPG